MASTADWIRDSLRRFLRIEEFDSQLHGRDYQEGEGDLAEREGPKVTHPYKVKNGVCLYDMHPKIEDAIGVAAEIFYEITGLLMTITSARDGQHSVPNSLHYEGAAFDIRTREDNTTVQFSQMLKQQIADRLRSALGPDFDIVVASNHLHIEYDPK